MKTLKITTIALSLFLGLLFIGSILQGVYISGDTISHFEHAKVATNVLMAFIIHPREWPPFLGILLHGLINLTPDVHIFSLASNIFAFLASWTSIFFVSKKMSWSTSTAAILATSVLLLPMQGIVHLAFISESFMITFWLLGSIFLYLFLTEKKETHLVFFTIFASMIPMTRYLGAVVVLWYCFMLGLLILYTIFKKKKTHYSKWLVVAAAILVWVPILFFLFRTKILIGSFFGTHDMKYDFDLFEVIYNYVVKIVTDMGLISGLLFLYGLTLKSNKRIKTFLAVTGGSSLIYLLGLLNVERVYAIYEHLPSRFTLVAYPFVALSAVFIGVLTKDRLAHHFAKFKKYQLKFKQLLYLIFILVFSFSIFNQSKLYLSEREDISSSVEGLLWSGDIRNICRKYQINAIIRHEASRNWGLRSFPMICKQEVRSIDLNSENRYVHTNEGIVSGYEITLNELTFHEHTLWDGYPIYIYTVNTPVELPLELIFAEREKFQ